MAATYFDIGREQGTEEGVEHGQEVERQAWLASGHDEGQCTPIVKPRSFMSTAFQTDATTCSNVDNTAQSCTTVSTQTSTVSHLDASIQALESPPSLSQPTQPQKMSTARLNWAEETESLPITPLPPPLHQPRDLSVLRSPSSSSPFSSLQHRSKH